MLPPLTKAPTFTIRKRPGTVFRLEGHVTKGVKTAGQADLLRQAVADHRNILGSGGTSSSKTTLLNALLAEPAITEDRVVLIEDTRELQCAADDQVQLLTKRTEPRITMRDLVQTTSRLRSDRIGVGEIRDGAGDLEMLKAWNTGHDGGLGTLHANSGSDALHAVRYAKAMPGHGCRFRQIVSDDDLQPITLNRPDDRTWHAIISCSYRCLRITFADKRGPSGASP